MGMKTMRQSFKRLGWFRRQTIPKHTLKWLNRLRSELNEEWRRQKGGKKPGKRRKGAKSKYSRRVGFEDRITIEAYIKAGLTQAEIACKTGFSKSTISRELKRNTSQRGYRHQHAQNAADARVSKKASARRKFTEEMWQMVIAKVKLGWTFEQICQRARKEGRVCVCKEVLYREYYLRQRLVSCGLSQEELPPLPRRQKKRKTRDRNAKKYRTAGRGRIPGRVDIDQRPKEINNRARAGHWEGDLINGNHGTGNLATLVERMSRYTLFCYVETKETDAVMAVITELLKGLPEELRKTLTFDNGKEFAKFEMLKKALGLDVYFAKPYHSWERGTNENRNGIIRRILPKGTDFTTITREQMERIDYLLNDRPMKCLNWRTPREVFTERLKYYRAAA